MSTGRIRTAKGALVLGNESPAENKSSLALMRLAYGSEGVDFSLVSAHEDLIAARPEDLYVRWSMTEPDQIFIDGRNVAAWRHHHRTGDEWLTVTGDDATECAAFAASIVEKLKPQGITLPLEVGSSLGLPAGDRWSFWVTEQPTSHRPTHVVVEIDHNDPDLMQLLTHSSSAQHLPGGMPPVRWLGLRIDDQLVSIGAQTSLREPAGHIAAVVTHEQWRGRGLAMDVCATLLNSMLDAGKPAVCLGMWADNIAATSVYSRLGFTNTGVRTSVPLSYS